MTMVLLRFMGSLAVTFLATSGSCCEAFPFRGRELSLADNWAISLVNEGLVDDTVKLTFNHGTGGGPGYQIYGKAGFEAYGGTEGYSCRSHGADYQGELNGNPHPSGMTVFLDINGEGTQSVLSMSLDKMNLPFDLMHTDDIEGNTIIEYCVFFFLGNEDLQPATALEITVTVNEGQDGQIAVGNFASTRAEPLRSDFLTSVGVEASLCGVPAAGQNSIISVCLTCLDSTFRIGSVTDFTFVGSNSGEVDVTQIAYKEGVAGSLTAGVSNEDGSYRIDTLLKADFYLSETTNVVGQGRCTIGSGRRLQTRPVLSSGTANEITGDGEDDVPVGLAFVIGPDGIVESDLPGEPERSPVAVSHTHHPSTWSMISMVIALIAATLSMVSIGLSLQLLRVLLRRVGMDERGAKADTDETRTNMTVHESFKEEKATGHKDKLTNEMAVHPAWC